MKPAMLAAALLLGGCMRPLPVESFAGDRPGMRPERFFDGHATSWGVIETASGAPAKRIHVESFGKAASDGSFRLDQIIDEAGRKRTRFWILRAVDAHRYTGTLSDAAGPVTGEAYGNLFHLRYKLKQPAIMMEQWLYLQEDGRTLFNVGRVSLFGFTIARLSERISHVDKASDKKRAAPR